MVLNKVFEHLPILSDAIEGVTSVVLKGMPQNWGKYLYCIGSIALTVTIFRKLSQTCQSWHWIFSHNANLKNLNKQNLIKKYGDCWIGITGFTEGIGWAYALMMSEMGFNLILIGRNQYKCNLRAEYLDKYYPNTLKNYIVADLSTKDGVNQVVKDLKFFSEKVDIGIFVNNAGITAGGAFLQINPKALLQCSFTNFNAVVEINKEVVPMLLKRGKKGALINISSCTGTYLSANIGVYSMSKHALNQYTLNL